MKKLLPIAILGSSGLLFSQHPFLEGVDVRPIREIGSFEGARLQPCRKRSGEGWALAPEGSLEMLVASTNNKIMDDMQF
jgi:hypothetical protein